MDKVCDDHSPIIITRKSQRSVVMISLEDYQALEETAYLLRCPKMPEDSWSPLLSSDRVVAPNGS